MGFAATGFAAPGTKTIVNITAFKVLLSSIAERPRSKTELHAITGLTNTTISRWMRVLSSGKDRIVYVERWDRTGKAGCYTAMWRMGHGMPDAPKPRPKTATEHSRFHRAKRLREAGHKMTQTGTGLVHKLT